MSSSAGRSRWASQRLKSSAAPRPMPSGRPSDSARVRDLLHLRSPAPGLPCGPHEAPAVDAFAGERVLDAVRARDRVRLRRERGADLVPAAERHLQRRGRADAALERDRLHVARPGRGHATAATSCESPDRYRFTSPGRDDRAVDAAQVAGDPLHTLGRDRIPFDVDPVEALGRDLAGHVLGDRRRAEADHELALGDQLANGPHVAKRFGAPSRVASLRPSLAQSTSPSTAEPTSAPISPGKRSPTRVMAPSSRTRAPARLAHSQQPPNRGMGKRRPEAR